MTDPHATEPFLVEVARRVHTHIASRSEAEVCPRWTENDLHRRLDDYDFSDSRDAAEVAGDLLDMLATYAVRNDSPRYFGLFNPPPLSPAIAGDLVTAAVNPQLAVWSHAPAAAEIERRLIRLFGDRIWRDDCAGTFTSGGSEANFTALLCALSSRYPQWASAGLRALPGGLTIYASSESHLAWIKLARSAGLGADAVRLVRARDGLRLDAETLREAIAGDGGRVPLMVVATAGTTAHGAVDDLAGLADTARDVGAYFHVDAAWAGGALLALDAGRLMPGIERAESVTIDPHKWLAVPMGAGMFLSRSWADLSTAFSVSTSYMPSADTVRHDAYINSAQWSRRFIGGKLFTALGTLGLEGYRQQVLTQMERGDELRALLKEAGWTILNDTDLPLVNFSADGLTDDDVRRIEASVAGSGRAWLSSVALTGSLVLRACVTSFETSRADVRELVDLLASARADLRV